MHQIGMKKVRYPINRRVTLVASVLLGFAGVTMLGSSSIHLPENTRFELGSYVLNCVQISSHGQSEEGLGALFRRNQFALFLAETYKARLAFPPIESEHGYRVDEMFDKCPKPTNSCVISQEEIILNRCPRADCACHRRKMIPYVTDLVKRCPSILVNNDVSRTMEYSGCFGKTVARYFGSDKKELVDYDAIHIRTGDLAEQNGGKAYKDAEIYFLLRAMCILSDRDIVIVTEGEPELPIVEQCRGRLVLAGDTNLSEAFQIFQHAKHLSAGPSSFAVLLMEMAKPTRMIALHRAANFFEWVDVEDWTIIGKRGAVFHFDSKAMMVDTCLSGRDLMFRSFKTEAQYSRMKDKLEFEVPERIWTNDGRWIRPR